MINIWSYTTFQTDGFTDNFIDIISNEQIDQLVKSLWNIKDFFCFWWWSNLLFSKSSYENKLFIRNNFKWIENLGDNLFRVKAWENLTLFVNYLNKLGISIFNPLFGLPGTVWGAVVGNAGCFWIEIWNFVKSITYIENWTLINSENYVCTYRDSNLKWKNIILLEIEFYIPQIEKQMETGLYYNTRRKQNQEYWKTCGSYFKNVKLKLENWKLYRNSNLLDTSIIENILKNDKNNIYSSKFGSDGEITVAAWWLIDTVGLKWFEYNWVQISNIHANFIMNYTNKDPNNIIQLSNIIKEKVSDKFWLLLEEEVIIV